jgi:hypothetical protein
MDVIFEMLDGRDSPCEYTFSDKRNMLCADMERRKKEN